MISNWEFKALGLGSKHKGQSGSRKKIWQNFKIKLLCWPKWKALLVAIYNLFQ